MCGFAGIIDPTRAEEELRARTVAMLESMRHRGPDGDGLFLAPKAGLSLGHRRLAIIDPGHGHQPMSTPDGHLTVIFNGAIYNYLELRRELIGRGHSIASYSDTEVLLFAYREWGERCVDRFLGMFSFAIWDQQNQTLFCARDRVGIKPFYLFFDGRMLLIASEIKGLLASGLIQAEANPDGLQDYLTFQFCLGEKTMFKGVRKLEPGHSLTVHVRRGKVTLTGKQYWDVDYEIDDAHDEAWFVDRLAGLIEDATRIHLRSDVPLGAHLSGGLDSSAVVCLAADALKGERLKTFTGAFAEGPEYDETAYAKLVAEFSGTDYEEIYIQGDDLPDLLPKLMYFMDEPQAGPGLIPQYYVSKLAAEKVKVVLGGQGGDELFIGYARYLVGYLEQCLSGAIFETSHQAPYAVTLESIVPTLPLLRSYVPMLQELWRDGLFEPPEKRYFKLIDRGEGMARLFQSAVWETGYSPFAAFNQIFNRRDLHSLINRMTYFDLKGSLPALLHVEDRTSMAVSIESRVPLLDHRIIEFMAKIPPNIKFAGGRMKHLFKESVRHWIPAQVFERKDKMGFPTPITRWVKGVANEFVRETLLSGQARARGLYNMAEMERLLAGEREFGRVIWGLLCLELWHRVFLDDGGKTGIGR